jgi:hypothetical protein
MHDTLAALLWIAAVTLLLAALAFLVLKWIALRIARRVAESAEQRLAESVQRGLSRSGLESRVEADHERRAKYLSQIERLAWLTDRVVPLPIVGGIGIDAVLGVVPVAGDLVSLGISSIVVVRAAQLGVPQELIARLVAIQCTDLALGAVPWRSRRRRVSSQRAKFKVDCAIHRRRTQDAHDI